LFWKQAIGEVLLRVAQVRVLSGGEKARLALAKFMLTPGTLLVLDEPTNHLDIPSKEMLEDALTAFPGAVISVSHDRYFLRKIATRIIAVIPYLAFALSTSMRTAVGGYYCIMYCYEWCMNGPASDSFTTVDPCCWTQAVTWCGAQVEDCSLRDYEGNYSRFLEKNEGEAEVMAEKEAKRRELEKSQIKAKSKVGMCPNCLSDCTDGVYSYKKVHKRQPLTHTAICFNLIVTQFPFRVLSPLGVLKRKCCCVQLFKGRSAI